MRSISAERVASFTPLFILIYFALQLAVRLSLSANLEVDDAEMVGQTAWAWGYANSHPPLYHWLVRISYEAFGSWTAATNVPKFALLAAGYLFVYDAARRAADSTIAGALAVATLFFIPVLSWKTESKLTHSILGFAATAAMMHAVVLIVRNGKAWSFFWLGCAAAAGLLAKYNFLIVLAASLVAVASVPEAREKIFRQHAWIALAVCLLLIAPHLFWLRSHFGFATERLYMLKTGGGPLGLNLPASSIWDGLLSFLLIGLVSTMPAGGICALGKFARWRTLNSTHLIIRRVTGRWALMEVVVLALVVIAGGLTQVHERYLLILLPPFALWLALRFETRRSLLVAAILAMVITFARPVTVMRADSRLAWPYAMMADQIGKLGLGPVSVLGDRAENAANIAIHLPDASIFDRRQPAPNVLLVADDAGALRKLSNDLAGYEPETAELRASGPMRWQPAREATLVAQRWRKIR